MLVDDATVEIENINRNFDMGKPITVAILDGASQIAVPAIVATLAICIVFFPVVLLSGASKYLFTPMALAVVLAMLSSLLCFPERWCRRCPEYSSKATGSPITRTKNRKDSWEGWTASVNAPSSAFRPATDAFGTWCCITGYSRFACLDCWFAVSAVLPLPLARTSFPASTPG